MAAITAYGFVWTSTPRDLNRGFTLAAYGKPAADEESGAAPALNNTGVNAASSNDGNFRTAVFQFPPVQAAVLKADMMRPRDEAPPADRPQVHAPVCHGRHGTQSRPAKPRPTTLLCQPRPIRRRGSASRPLRVAWSHNFSKD
jgi:hypothetical protein